MGRFEGRTVGWAICGSHHTVGLVLPCLREMRAEGATVLPILSETLLSTPTRHGTPSEWLAEVTDAAGRAPLTTIPEVEPFGPDRTLDVLMLAPCTGSSLARFSGAITDSAPLMAAKAQLRNGRPVVVGISTNDGLGLNAANLARLLVARHVYFVPFGQDSPQVKPTSLVAHWELCLPSALAALEGRQLQPLLQSW